MHGGRRRSSRCSLTSASGHVATDAPDEIHLKKTTIVSAPTVRAVFVLAAMLLLPAAALRAETQACPPGFERYAEYRLFFGRGKPGGGTVSDDEWSGFLAAEVTPRFPDGLTVLDAAGQWRDGSGAIGREGAKLLIILAEPGADTMRRTKEIAEAYKRAFDQESVLRAVGTACAAF